MVLKWTTAGYTSCGVKLKVNTLDPIFSWPAPGVVTMIDWISGRAGRSPGRLLEREGWLGPRRHRTEQMWLTGPGAAHVERPAGAGTRGGHPDRGRQQHRRLELHLRRERVRQPPLQRREGPRLQPHPVRNRPREAECLGRKGMQVDGVAVAGHRAVLAADALRYADHSASRWCRCLGRARLPRLRLQNVRLP